MIILKRMIKRSFNLKMTLILIILGFFYLQNIPTAFAAIPPGDPCFPNNNPPQVNCDKDSNGQNYSCLPAKAPPPDFLCQIDLFGKIQPPDSIKKFAGTDNTGAAGISKFLSNLIILIYSIAAVVLIFMLIWGAFDWLMSGGDKEKIQSAWNKIINAIIGIILFAVAFGIISVLGQFTGFKFFNGQNMQITKDVNGNIIRLVCPDGYTLQDNDPNNPHIYHLSTNSCVGHGT